MLPFVAFGVIGFGFFWSQHFWLGGLAVFAAIVLWGIRGGYEAGEAFFGAWLAWMGIIGALYIGFHLAVAAYSAVNA